MFKKNNIDTLRATVNWTGKGKVEVSGEDDKKTTYEAKHIILAPAVTPAPCPTFPSTAKK